MAAVCPQVDELDRAGIVEVAAGGWHSAALTAGGVCFIWVRTHPPARISSLPTHPLLTSSQGERPPTQAPDVPSFAPAAQGRGEYGRLGLGENWKDRLRPTELPLTDRIRDVRFNNPLAPSPQSSPFSSGPPPRAAAGLFDSPHSCAATSPRLQVTCGGSHSLVCTVDGKLLSFGRPTFGRLGRRCEVDSSASLICAARSYAASSGGLSRAASVESCFVSLCSFHSTASNPNIPLPVEFPPAGEGLQWKALQCSAGGRHTLALLTPVPLQQHSASDSGSGVSSAAAAAAAGRRAMSESSARAASAPLVTSEAGSGPHNSGSTGSMPAN